MRVRVVAVARRGGEPGRPQARHDGHAHVAAVVAVGVHEAGERHALVEVAVAVVVEVVADLEIPGASRGRQVVAVIAALRPARAIRVAARGVHVAVAVDVPPAERGAVAVLVVPREVAHLHVAHEAVGVRVVAVGSAARDAVGAVAVEVGHGLAVPHAAVLRFIAHGLCRAGRIRRRHAAERVRPRRAHLAGLRAVAEHAVVAVHGVHARLPRPVASCVGANTCVTAARESNQGEGQRARQGRTVNRHVSTPVRKSKDEGSANGSIG